MQIMMNLLRDVWNTAWRVKRWVAENPGRFVVGALAATAAISAAVGKLFTQNTATTAVDSFKGNTGTNNPASCPTIIFYESHTDKAPAETITKLFPILKKSGYKTFHFEEPTGMSLNENIDAYEKKKQYWLNYYTEKIKNNAQLTDAQRANAIYQIKGNILSLDAALILLREIQTADLNYVAIDLDTKTREELEKQSARVQGMPKHLNEEARNLDPKQRELLERGSARFTEEMHKKRDEHMAAQIMKACKEHGEGQVALVGVMHNGVEGRLQEAGYTQVASTYIIDHPPTRDISLPAERAENDIQLRQKNLLYMQKYGYENVNIINVYDNRKVNATKEALSGLRKRVPILL